MLTQVLITTAITALIAFLLETITGWAVGLGIGISTSVLDPKTFSFVLDNGAGGGLLNILPTIGGIGILGIFKAIGWTLLVVNCLIGIIGSMVNPAVGEKASSPQETIFGGIMTAILMVLTFGIGNIKGLIYYFGNIMDNFMRFATSGMLGENGRLATTVTALMNDVKAAINAEGDSVLQGIIEGDFNGNTIFIFIVGIAICTGCIGAAITHIERYFSLALSIVIGPTAIGFNSSQATKDTTKQWFIGLLTQSLAIILSILLWRMFFVQIVKPWSVFNTITSLVILSTIKNSEQIFNMIGLKTMPNTDTARSFLGAAATAAGSLVTAYRTVSSGANSLYGAYKNKKISDNNDKIANNELFKDIQNAKNPSDLDSSLSKWKNSHSKGLTFNADARAAKQYKELESLNAKATDSALQKEQSEYRNSLLSSRKYEDFQKASKVRDSIPSSKVSLKTDDKKGITGFEFNPDVKRPDNIIFNNGLPENGLTPEGNNALHNFNAAYFNDRAGAYGDKVATGNINSKYEELGKELFGSGYSLPQIPTCSTDRQSYLNPTLDNEFSMSIEKTDAANSSLSSSIQSVNSVMSENSTQEIAPAGATMEAFGLENYGLKDYGMVSGEISTSEDFVGYSGISLLSDEEGKQQLYTFLPADYAIPEGTTISPTIETMNAAAFELDSSNSMLIGDNIVAVPLKDVSENTNGISKDENLSALRAQTILHETFTQQTVEPVSTRYSGSGADYRRNGLIKENLKQDEQSK